MYAEYTAIHWLFFFYFYCFFGWCFESAYVSLKCKRLVNRGFMRGPFLPLYGTGGIMMLLVSMPFQDNIFLVYIVGCVGATVLEYVTGVSMEAIFKIRYWDYSNQKFNFRGHICLSSSLAWGGLTILMTECMHKPVERLAFMIPYDVLTSVVMLLTAVIGADYALSFKAALDLRDVLIRMEKAKKEIVLIQKRLDVIIALTNEELECRKDNIEIRVDEFRENVELHLEDMKDNFEEKIHDIRKRVQTEEAKQWENIREELFELRHKYRAALEEHESLSRVKSFFQRGMLQAHPNMSSEKFREALEELKKKATEHLGKKK